MEKLEMIIKNNNELNLKSNLWSILTMKEKDFDVAINNKKVLEIREVNDYLFLLSEKFFAIVNFISNILFYIVTTATVIGVVNDFFVRTIILINKFFSVLGYEIANSELDPTAFPVANRPPAKRIMLDKTEGHNLLTKDFTLYFQDYMPYLIVCATIVVLSCAYLYIKKKSIYKFLLIRKYTS